MLEDLHNVEDEIPRLTALLYAHGYESPYVVQSSQQLITAFVAGSAAGERASNQRRTE